MENVTSMEWVLRQNTPYSRKNELMGLFEDARDKVQTVLVDQVYKQILECSSAVKHEEIDKTKGDITKFKFYDDMVGVIGVIRSKGIQELTNGANIVDTSIGKLRTMKAEFTKAYTLNTPVPVILYQTTVMSILDALSSLIRYSNESESTEDDSNIPLFVTKAVNSGTGKRLKLDAPITVINIGIGGKKVPNSNIPLSFSYLQRFNESCDKNVIKKTITECNRFSLYNYETGDERLAVKEDGILAMGIAIGVVLVAIPLIREAVFYFYYGRMKLSDYCKELALYLEINKTEVKNNKKFTADEKKSILDKQQKVMDKLLTLSDKLRVQKLNGEKMAEKEVVKKNKEITLDKVKSDIMNSDSTGGVTSDSPGQLNSGFEFE